MKNSLRLPLTGAVVTVALFTVVQFGVVTRRVRSGVKEATAWLERARRDDALAIDALVNATAELAAMGDGSERFEAIRSLVEETRATIVRIKNVPEKKGENLFEKVGEVLFVFPLIL